MMIGITTDYVDPTLKPEGAWYSPRPWFGMRHPYVTAIVKKGGIPVLLPCALENLNTNVKAYAQKLQGLVITGGGFDIPPELYGASEKHPTVKPNPQRTTFEKALLEAFLEVDKPIFGICGGAQLINVAFGGTLFQHIPHDHPNALNHLPENDPHHPYHSIEVISQTKLFEIFGQAHTSVNSSHHQAIHKVGKGLRVNAISSEDGIVEGVESESHRFCVGLQWHPEFFSSPIDHVIFESFLRMVGQEVL